MLTTDPDQQLDELLGASIASFDIPDEVYERAVERYRDIGAWLADYWAESPSDGEVYPQGSFRLGTVVQPIHQDGEYDIDLVCRRDIAKESTTQAALKQDVGGGLGLYVRNGPEGRPTLSEGKRCWTLDYAGEPFHLDVLPALPDPEATPNGIILTDRALREWQHSNPIDYASWFRRRMREEFIQLREAVAKRMDVDDVPEWKVKTTLQRTVQALKRHRDMFFAETPDEGPASIIITTLAARAYAGAGLLHRVLADMTGKMPGLVGRKNGVLCVPNPVQSEENFADRWETHPERARGFFEWMRAAQSDFSQIGEERGVDRVLNRVAAAFGQEPADRAGEAMGDGLSTARDAGLLGMAGGSGMLGPATGRSVRRHTFHGDAPGPDS